MCADTQESLGHGPRQSALVLGSAWAGRLGQVTSRGGACLPLRMEGTTRGATSILSHSVIPVLAAAELSGTSTGSPWHLPSQDTLPKP